MIFAYLPDDSLSMHRPEVNAERASCLIQYGACFVHRRSENTNAICEKTAGLRSGNFSDLNSTCSKMLVTVKIFQFHDMINENSFSGHICRSRQAEHPLPK